MREDLVKLKQLRDNLIGIELDIDIHERDLFMMNKDLEYMEIVQATLNENLRILKLEKVIAMVVQYRRTLEELEYIDKRISQKKYEIKITTDRLDKLYRKFDTYKIDYDAHKKFVESQKVVLFFDQKKRKVKGST